MAFSIPFRRHRNGAHSEHKTLSREEFETLVDSEARRLLGISGQRFRELREAGELPEKKGVRTLAMMLDLESVR